MTVGEARKLKVGQRVEWTADGGRGTVRETSYAAVKIEWDDKKWAMMCFCNRATPFNLLRKLTGSYLLGGESERKSSSIPRLGYVGHLGEVVDE